MRGGEFQNTCTSARLIAIAGAKGGVGRSTCAVAMARALVIRERRVLLAEFCTLGSSLSTMLDISEPITQAADTFKPVSTPLTGLDWVCFQANVFEKHENAQSALQDLCTQLRQMEYDDIVIDLCSGTNIISQAIYLCADLPVLISDPEPDSLQLTVRWLEYIISEFIKSSLPALETPATPWSFVKIYEQMPASHQNDFIRALGRFKCAFLLNHRREQSEALQCTALCHALGMMLGIHVHALGSLSADERRWFYARRMADVSLFMREDPLARELEAILRENTPTFDTAVCLPILDAKMQARELLRVKTSGEARSAYRRLWEGYKRENGLVSAVMPRQMITHTIQLLEIAHRNAELENTLIGDSSAGLSQPGYRSGGLPNTPENMRHRSGGLPNTPENMRHSGGMFNIRSKISPQDCTSDAGQWLQNQRNARQMTLSQLAMKTRIPLRVLEHFESMTFEPMAFPRFSAYLFEIARGLDLSTDELKRRFGL